MCACQRIEGWKGSREGGNEVSKEREGERREEGEPEGKGYLPI